MDQAVRRPITGTERDRRTRAVNAVIHSGRLEGFADNREWIQQMLRFAKGEITREELRAFAHGR
jgi:hypothetical protein